MLKGKVGHIKMFKSLFKHTLISVGQHQTKAGRSTPPTGVRGEISIEKTWKQSKEII